MAKIKGIKFPESISIAEKGMYHVAIVNSTPNPVTLEFDHKVDFQCFGDRAWRIAKDRFKQLGMTNVVLFHSPEVEGEDVIFEGGEESAEEGKVIDLGSEGGEGKSDKVDRAALIQEAKDAGYTGALNVKNEVFQAFIAQKVKEAQEAIEAAKGSEGGEGSEGSGEQGGQE